MPSLGPAPSLCIDMTSEQRVFLLMLRSLYSRGYLVSYRDLALVGNMGGDPGDELEVVHPLHLFVLFPVPVADLALFLIQGEPLQGQKRADHVFAHPLGLF